MIAKSVQSLADRYDPSAVVPPLEARVRLVSGDEAHDALVDGRWHPHRRRRTATSPTPSSPARPRPGAAPPTANGGLAALGRGGLRMRHNLHVATGFLAATAGDDRLRLETVETRHGPIATAQAGSGPVAAGRARPGRNEGLVPAHAGADAADAPRDRDRPAGLRRLGQAAARAVRRPLLRRRASRDVLDALGIDRAHMAGNSMGGRIALELALTEPARVDRLVLLCPRWRGCGRAAGRRWCGCCGRS